MFCSQCGNQIASQTSFCSQCGNKVDKPETPGGNNASLQKFIANLDNGEIAPSMSALDRLDHKKLRAAKDAYLQLDDENESVLILYDDTVFGGAKDGFAITDKRFIAHMMSSWGGSKRRFEMPLTEIQEFRIEKAQLATFDVSINGKVAGNISQVHGVDLARVNMLLALVIGDPGSFAGASLFASGTNVDQPSTAAQTAPAPTDQSNGANWLSTLGGLAFAAAVGYWIFDSSGGSFGNSAAAQIIRESLHSPSSYTEIDSRVLWTGQNAEGLDARIVRVEYEAQNGFGAMIRNCNIVSYYEDGDQIRWNTVFGVQSCDFGFLSEADAVDLFRETNFGTKAASN
jgi:hypothetical protein